MAATSGTIRGKSVEKRSDPLVAALVVGLTWVGLVSPTISAQLPLATPKASGQTVTPAYEGWYRNAGRHVQPVVRLLQPQPDGSRRDPDRPEQLHRRPARRIRDSRREFQPRRHWGVFAVKVPADFGAERGRLDAEVPRRDVRDSRHAASELADRRARRRSRLGQHAAGAASSPRTGPKARGPFGVDRRAGDGDRRANRSR